jgi:hypothetical protein
MQRTVAQTVNHAEDLAIRQSPKEVNENFNQRRRCYVNDIVALIIKEIVNVYQAEIHDYGPRL